MGCDIHDYCEIKTENGWEMLGDIFDDPYNEGRKICRPYRERNYSLFGLLAGVREDNITPISEPRGVPSDASDGFLEEVKSYGIDGHTRSYLTLKEMLDYNYDYESVVEGYVHSSEYERFKKEGSPYSWCGGVGGGHIFIISNEDMDDYLANPDNFVKENAKSFWELRAATEYATNRLYAKEILNKLEVGVIPQMTFYTHITWKEKVRDRIGTRWFKVLEQLKTLAPDGDYKKIRLVFFFDN